VALVVKCLGVPLDQSGRLVSEVFFYATLLPAYVLLGSFRVRPRHRLVFLSLLLVSPQYLYWSRTFMIESTALFCAMAYFAFALRALDRWRPADLAGAALFGAFAAMVKITTFFAFFLAAGLCLLSAWWQTGAARFSRTVLVRHVVSAVPIALLPLLCGTLWTAFAEAAKAQNPLAAGFITSAALVEWNFGTAAQRLSGELWSTLLQRTVPEVLGHGTLVVAGVALLFVGRRRRLLFAVCVALFLSAPMTFTNLYVAHNYYAYANGVFLIAAIGWCVVGCLERVDRRRWLAVVVLVCALCAALWRYQQEFLPRQRHNATRILDTARIVESVTAPDETVIILGIDWNPALPYYARRRALMDHDGRPPEDPVMRQALAKLEDWPVGAVVVCGAALQQRRLIVSWLRSTGLSAVPRRTAICEIYTRPA
jgi:hypothetical protein